MDLPLKLAIARLFNGISPISVLQAQTDWLAHLLSTPSKRAELAGSAMRKGMQWAEFVGEGLVGAAMGEGGASRPLADKRFARAGWDQLPYAAWAQAFLLAQQWWEEAGEGVRGVSLHHREVSRFLVRQWLDMLSPSNFIVTNPEVIQQTMRTGGANLASGAAHWARDFVAVLRGGDALGIEDFRPGRELALTPGKVVMRNRLVELIQYEPATPVVGREPVLIVPSWIMKYYILDLTPDDSMVAWLVEQGHTVFIVSWRNPGGEDAALGMDDYLHHGVLEALATVREIVPDAGVHGMGYCLGGTLFAIGAALLGARGDRTLKTLSLLAAQVDFQEPGELGLFIDESQIAFLEDVMAEHGYLDGRRMAGAFQLINSKDLVWSKLVHEYLMGGTTPLTPLRAWNADATRMPARMHSEYLRGLYLNNDLAEGRWRACGEVVSLSRITVPMFLLATERDHVSPWPSVWKALRLVHAPATFVLCAGGHNVGIVNPPEGPAANGLASWKRLQFKAGEAPADPHEIVEAAASHTGSWWPAWEQWLRRHSSGKADARRPRGIVEGGSEVAAPGTFVHQR